MNHVNLTFHLATKRLIYQNSPFFFFFFFPHLLPIMALGKTLCSWTGSGSGLISELCQDQAGMPSISPPGWSLYREIVSITEYRRFFCLSLPGWCLSVPSSFNPTNVYPGRPPACPHGWILSHPLLPPMAQLLENLPAGLTLPHPLQDAEPS